MTRDPIELLKAMARHTITHAKNNTMDYAEDVMELPASTYFDQGLFDLELRKIFGRIPMVLGPSCEISANGDYKTLKVGKASIIVVRDRSGKARGFMNACRHRGAKIINNFCGNVSRFTCPFHGWSYGTDGKLLSIAAREDFGEVDKSLFGLREFPVLEKAGLIWGIVNPDTKLPIEPFLKGYDTILASFEFEKWNFFSKRSFKSPNWKLSYDGYLEYYHVPVLHGQTFGTDSTNRGLYYTWGPHQHIKSPDLTPGHVATETLGYMTDIADKSESEWDVKTLSYGVWTAFPCTSIASFGAGGRGALISQVLPGEKVGESTTFQYYIMEKLPETEDLAKAAEAQFAWVQGVVEGEDIAMANSAQDTLSGSGIGHLLLGRNELGNQHFHRWCKYVIDADTDSELLSLYSSANVEFGIPVSFSVPIGTQ